MDRKRELKLKFKERKTQAGIYAIKNTKNKKVFIGSSKDLNTMNGRRFELNMGTYPNRRLQKDWNEYGEEAFTFEVLEVLKPDEKGNRNVKEALERLKEKWLDQLQPFGERGYN